MSDQLTTILKAATDLQSSKPSTTSPTLAAAPDDTRRAARIGLWALGIGFGGFLLWAGLAPLDEGVPSTAQVAIDTKRKAVQHQFGGLIREVLVREGDVVKEGQVLMRLDDATAQANFQSTRQRYLGLRAMEGRLQAEQASLTSIRFNPDLVEAGKTDPLIQQHMLNQEQLFGTRRAALTAELQSIEESIQGQQGLLTAYTSMLESRRSQSQLLNDELRNTRELVKDGYVPRNRQFELERQVAEVSLNTAELTGNIVRGQRTIAEFRQRAIARRQDFRREVESQLSDVSREVQSEVVKFTATAHELQRTEIRAPVSGQVVGLAYQTVGGVVPAGQRIMDIVPEGEQLLLEAHVAPNMIDRLSVSMPVDIRFSSFTDSPQLVVNGSLISVSKDLLTDPQTNAHYYLARVAVTPPGLKKLGNRHLQPGMPAEVIFSTGERSLLTYMLHPLTKRIAASMTEE